MMRPTMRARILGGLVGVLLAPAPARADTIPLSSLPAKPARYTQAAGAAHAAVETEPSFYRIRGDGASVCFVTEAPAYWVDGDGFLDGRTPVLHVGAREPFGIERVVTRGDGAELERITAEVVLGKLEPLARSRISLHAVAKLDGITVYAYRWHTTVYLLAPSLAGASRRRDDRMFMDEAPECAHAYTLLRVRNGASQPVQIRGHVPATGKPFLVDASITQTSRDPEPLLSVTARLLDR